MVIACIVTQCCQTLCLEDEMRQTTSCIAAVLVFASVFAAPSAHAAFDVDQCLNLAKRLHISRLVNDCPKLGPVGTRARDACDFAAEVELAWEKSLCLGRGLPGGVSSAFDRYLDALARSMSPLYPG